MVRRTTLSVEERKKLIAEIEGELNARVIAVVTGDRRGMETRIAPDMLPLLPERLSAVGTCERVALFLYTPGGDSVAGWGLVNLFREYCKKFAVVVPFRALSCGTLIALGADELFLGRHGLLSPIDPSVISPFSPKAPGPEQPGSVSLIPVSVEDMNGFLDLAKKEIGLKSEQNAGTILSILTSHVHPLALGAVYRAREQNSSLATRLLAAHCGDKQKVDRIVSKLTRELPTHSYLIGRKEAKDHIELELSDLSEELEGRIWRLYREYADWLQLTSPASTALDLAGGDRKLVTYERAVIESLHDGQLAQHIFVTKKELLKVRIPAGAQAPPIDQIGERLIYEGWQSACDGEA
ncbi:MAG: hypothetical protein HYX92_12380 [Chloroflexi bacterium]|nr:hypothetical protein [Chloroflexota bacterium]